MNKPSMNQGSWSRGLVLLILGVPCAVALCVSGCGSSSSAGGDAGAAAAASADAGASGEANSMAAGAAGVVDTAGAGGSAGEGGALDEPGMFGALGVDITTSPRTYQDSNGKVHPLGDDYNPLGRGVKSLQPQAEVYLAGLSFADSTANQFLLDSAGVNPAKKALPITDGADTWAGNRYVKSLPIDVDGDGVDEIANVYYVEASHELHANLIRCTAGCDGDGGKFTNVKDSLLAVQDSTLVPTERHWFSHGLLAADVDGDGKQELVVANFGGIDVCVPNKKLEFACTARVKENKAQTFSLARGHFTDNLLKHNDDIVALWSDGVEASVAVYDGDPDSFADNAYTNPNRAPISLSLHFVGQSAVTTYIDGYVDAGDIDHDGMDEIVISARRPADNGVDTWWHDLILLDDARVNYRPFKAFRFGLGADGGHPYSGGILTSNQNNGSFHPALKVFTKRTTPTFEKAIYAGAYIIDSLDKIEPSDTTSLKKNEDLTNGVTSTFTGFRESGGGGSYSHAPAEVVTGDIDGTGKDSIVALWDQTKANGNSTSEFHMSTIGRIKWDEGMSKWTDWQTIASTTAQLAPITSEYDWNYGTGLCLPNVDRDSPILEYQGQHELLFSEPRVLAVLAAAPFYKGENETGSSTSIAFGSGTGFSSDSTIGLRAGFSIGYEAPSLFGLSTFETKASFGFAMDWNSSQQVTLTQTQTWTAGGEDAVVFQVIPFDVYYYNVVSSPDPEDLQKPLSINVPRTLSTYKVPVSLYNRSILNGPKITKTLLGHRVGDPASYPTKNVCADATATGSFGDTSFLVDQNEWCFASADALQVGVGTGSVGFTIARSKTSSEGTSQDVSVDFEVIVGSGGLKFGASAGFHYGYGYTVDASQSYSFSGQVADLPSADHGYKFGLMAHRGALPGLSTDYPVFLVDYWVEDLK